MAGALQTSPQHRRDRRRGPGAQPGDPGRPVAPSSRCEFRSCLSLRCRFGFRSRCFGLFSRFSLRIRFGHRSSLGLCSRFCLRSRRFGLFSRFRLRSRFGLLGPLGLRSRRCGRFSRFELRSLRGSQQ